MTDNYETSPRRLVAEAISCAWWIALLRGLLLIALGAYALFQPNMTLVALTQVVGIFVVVDGVSAIITALLGWTDSPGWTIARGVLGIVVGGFVIGQSALIAGVTAMFVMYVLALHALAAGALEIVVAIRQRKVIEGEGWLILNGVLTILFGIILAIAPLLATYLLIRILGAYAIFFGVSILVFSWGLKGLGRRISSLD